MTPLPMHANVKWRERALGMGGQEGFILVTVLVIVAALTLATLATATLAASSQRRAGSEEERVQATYAAEGIQAEVWSALHLGAPLTRNQWYASGNTQGGRFAVVSTADILVVEGITQATRGRVCREVRQRYALAAGPSDPVASRVAGTYSERGCSA